MSFHIQLYYWHQLLTVAFTGKQHQVVAASMKKFVQAGIEFWFS
jgi:hypothetical protein